MSVTLRISQLQEDITILPHNKAAGLFITPRIVPTYRFYNVLILHDQISQLVLVEVDGLDLPFISVPLTPVSVPPNPVLLWPSTQLLQGLRSQLHQVLGAGRKNECIQIQGIVSLWVDQGVSWGSEQHPLPTLVYPQTPRPPSLLEDLKNFKKKGKHCVCARECTTL